jgi:Tfp pilus assembly protein PilN
MKLSINTALGIDISESLITLALLKQSAKGLELLKCASGPVPDGAIKNGNIEKPESLAKAIKELKSHNRIRAGKAAVSLSAVSTIADILEAPKGAPSNIGQFVHNELKSYVALSGREITFDFCGIKPGQGSGDRLLAVAADSEELALLTRTCRRAHLNVEAVEPPILGYIRALFAERIEGRFDSDVLIAILHGSALTLCVFRKQVLDFVRVEHIGKEQAEPDKLCQWLAGEINVIIQYYDIEVADSAGKWEITVVTDGMQLPGDAETSLKAKVESADLEVRTGENACQDIIVDQNSNKGQSSALAIGLAMGLLDARQIGLRINLVPPESAEVRAVKKQLVLTTIVIVLAIPLLMMAAGAGFARFADKIKTSTIDSNQAELLENTHTTFTELELLNQQINLISNEPDELNRILGSRPDLDWAKILDDVRVRTPEAVRITELSVGSKDGIVLKGLALSYEAARLFEKMLNDSEYFNSASLNETKKEGETGELVLYEIGCSMKMEKSKS